MADDNTETGTEETGADETDELAGVPPERLVGMLRDKRKSEATVRARLRETEGERDRLAKTVEAHQRDSLAQLARAGKVHEAAVGEVVAGIELGDVLRENGTVDEALVGEALKALKSTKPYLFDVPRVPGRSSDGGGPPVGGTGAATPADWSEVLRR